MGVSVPTPWRHVPNLAHVRITDQQPDNRTIAGRRTVSQRRYRGTGQPEPQYAHYDVHMSLAGDSATCSQLRLYPPRIVAVVEREIMT